jgi:Zn-dependent protease
MNSRRSPIYWSFPLGTCLATRVRCSYYFPLIVLVLCVHLGLTLGAVVCGILFVSVLLHEFGHVVAARLTGGHGDEILIWPLGGLAFVHPAGNVGSHVLTAGAGPLVNLTLCGATLAPVLSAGLITQVLNPLALPPVALTDHLLRDVAVLTCAVNWVLLLINLIPVYPLDGGRMLLSTMSSRMGNDVATEVYIRIGFGAGFLLLLAGLLLQSVWLVFIGAVVLVLNIQEAVQLQNGENYDESFMGYDFSQGYTSLERSAEKRRERRPGPYQRWRQNRQLAKRERERERELQEERTIDVLLAKVHTHGLNALTEEEKRLLERASDRYRNKSQPQGDA